MFVSSQTVIFLTLLFAFANCLACIQAGSFPQPGNHHRAPKRFGSFFLHKNSPAIQSRGGSIFVEHEQISNSTTTFHRHDTLVPPQNNETTAFRYSANVEEISPCKKGLKILFLSADTGGGHRASAESLANQVRLVHLVVMVVFFIFILIACPDMTPLCFYCTMAINWALLSVSQTISRI